MTFGENLKNERKKQKLTQKELAQKMKVSQQTINRWENSPTVPLDKNIVDIANILNIPINRLVDSLEWSSHCTLSGNCDGYYFPIDENGQKFFLVIIDHNTGKIENSIEYDTEPVFYDLGDGKLIDLNDDSYQKQLLDNTKNLNNKGFEKLLDFINDLNKIPDYTKTE